jgi:catechol 2,3-dioxygenase-like lactoylglutathione lyase family enzyme
MTIADTQPDDAATLPLFSADHVAVRVPDFEAAIQWYQDKLDFKLIQRFKVGDLEMAFISPRSSEAFRIELLSMPRQETQAADSKWGWDHLCLSVADVDETLAALRSRGLTIDRGPFVVDPIKKKIAFFSDPWGNTFEIMGPAK